MCATTSTAAPGSWSASSTEVESARHAARPELAKALAQCKRAKVVIAKPDRLSRNVAFLAALMDRGVDFVTATTRTPTSSPVTNSIQLSLKIAGPGNVVTGMCPALPAYICLRKEIRHLLGLRVASGKAAVAVARPHFNVAIYAARSVASFLDKPISGIFGCGSSRNRAIFAASNPGFFAITGNGGAWSVVVLVWAGVTT
jgi:Resolvase, N terminal domain